MWLHNIRNELSTKELFSQSVILSKCDDISVCFPFISAALCLFNMNRYMLR